MLRILAACVRACACACTCGPAGDGSMLDAHRWYSHALVRAIVRVCVCALARPLRYLLMLCVRMGHAQHQQVSTGTIFAVPVDAVRACACAWACLCVRACVCVCVGAYVCALSRCDARRGCRGCGSVTSPASTLHYAQVGVTFFDFYAQVGVTFIHVYAQVGACPLRRTSWSMWP